MDGHRWNAWSTPVRACACRASVHAHETAWTYGSRLPRRQRVTRVYLPTSVHAREMRSMHRHVIACWRACTPAKHRAHHGHQSRRTSTQRVGSRFPRRLAASVRQSDRECVRACTPATQRGHRGHHGRWTSTQRVESDSADVAHARTSIMMDIIDAQRADACTCWRACTARARAKLLPACRAWSPGHRGRRDGHRRSASEPIRSTPARVPVRVCERARAHTKPRGRLTRTSTYSMGAEFLEHARTRVRVCASVQHARARSRTS